MSNNSSALHPHNQAAFNFRRYCTSIVPYSQNERRVHRSVKKLALRLRGVVGRICHATLVIHRIKGTAALCYAGLVCANAQPARKFPLRLTRQLIVDTDGLVKMLDNLILEASVLYI